MNELVKARKEARESARGKEERLAKLRTLANDLLSFQPFREWAAEKMLDAGYFGYGAELTAFDQGLRGGVVRLFEEIAENADNGQGFIAEVFGKLKKGTK